MSMQTRFWPRLRMTLCCVQVFVVLLFSFVVLTSGPPVFLLYVPLAVIFAVWFAELPDREFAARWGGVGATSGIIIGIMLEIVLRTDWERCPVPGISLLSIVVCITLFPVIRARQDAPPPVPEGEPEAPVEDTPLCLRCLREVDSSQYYCENCGQDSGQLTPYIPFVNIRFTTNFYVKMWRIAWYDDNPGILRRAFCFLLLVLLVPVIFVGLPFMLIAKLREEKRDDQEIEEDLP